MTKQKPNISPSLVGELFLKPGEDIPYRLILVNTEPTAVIQRVDKAAPETPTGISGLSGLVHLKPERPIVKPPMPKRTTRCAYCGTDLPDLMEQRTNTERR